MAKTKKDILARLEKLQSAEPSSWKSEAEKERTDRKWLRHSQYIAVMVLSRLRELHLTQKDLAEKMECSQQYVSKIVSGKENLSLETITKIEEALDISFIKSPYQYFLDEETVAVKVAEDIEPYHRKG